MNLLKRKRPVETKYRQHVATPIICRCGGKPGQPTPISSCNDRWEIRCEVKRCYANNRGQGLADTIDGWNRLSEHFYR